MLPPCLRLSDQVFPRVRAIAAHRLAREGWTQARIAAGLGITQGMVSRQLAGPAPARDPLAHRLADELVQELAGPGSARGASPWCLTLSEASRPGDEAALADLLGAVQSLLAAHPLAVVPEIGLNLARATPGSADPASVLSLPGRIVRAGDRLALPAPPGWGASRHLAGALLAIRQFRPEVFALASLRGGRPVLQAARRLGWQVAEVTRRGRPDPSEAPLVRAARRHPDADAWHDAGAVGLEACLYLPATDCAAAARRILELEDQLA